MKPVNFDNAYMIEGNSVIGDIPVHDVEDARGVKGKRTIWKFSKDEIEKLISDGEDNAYIVIDIYSSKLPAFGMQVYNKNWDKYHIITNEDFREREDIQKIKDQKKSQKKWYQW